MIIDEMKEFYNVFKKLSELSKLDKSPLNKTDSIYRTLVSSREFFKNIEISLDKSNPDYQIIVSKVEQISRMISEAATTERKEYELYLLSELSNKIFLLMVKFIESHKSKQAKDDNSDKKQDDEKKVISGSEFAELVSQEFKKVEEAFYQVSRLTLNSDFELYGNSSFHYVQTLYKACKKLIASGYFESNGFDSAVDAIQFTTDIKLARYIFGNVVINSGDRLNSAITVHDKNYKH